MPGLTKANSSRTSNSGRLIRARKRTPRTACAHQHVAAFERAACFGDGERGGYSGCARHHGAATAQNKRRQVQMRQVHLTYRHVMADRTHRSASLYAFEPGSTAVRFLVRQNAAARFGCAEPQLGHEVGVEAAQRLLHTAMFRKNLFRAARNSPTSHHRAPLARACARPTVHRGQSKTAR